MMIKRWGITPPPTYAVVSEWETDRLNPYQTQVRALPTAPLIDKYLQKPKDTHESGCFLVGDFLRLLSARAEPIFILYHISHYFVKHFQ